MSSSLFGESPSHSRDPTLDLPSEDEEVHQLEVVVQDPVQLEEEAQGHVACELRPLEDHNEPKYLSKDEPIL